MKSLTAALAAIVLSFAASAASAACVDRIDMSEATGAGVTALPATICGASGMRVLLETASISDTLYAADGRDMIVVHIDAIKAGTMNDADLKAQSAKLIDIQFRAGSIIAFSNAKLKKKIEEYMAAAYVALFDQAVPLRRVRISALYPMSGGTEGVAYGTEIWNDKGHFGPGNRPRNWDTWRLNRDLR